MEVITTDQDTLIKVSHVIIHQEHQKVVSAVESFGEGKKEFEYHYSTSTVVMGANQQTGQVNIQVFTTALCIWMDTVSNYKAFQNKLQLNNGNLW